MNKPAVMLAGALAFSLQQPTCAFKPMLGTPSRILASSSLSVGSPKSGLLFSRMTSVNPQEWSVATATRVFSSIPIPDRCSTLTLKRMPGATRPLRPHKPSRISTETLSRQVPEGTVAKVKPRSPKRPWKLTGDYFPWIVGGIWTLLLTMLSESTLPAVIIGCIEIAFYIYNTILAQNANAPVQPESLSRDLMELWENCLKYSPDGPQAWLEGWFYDAPLDTLTKQDLLEFLAWGSCSTTWDLLTDASKHEIETVYALFENTLQRSFPERAPGQTPAAFMRFSIEPFEYRHKPTSYYWVCSFFLGLAGKGSLFAEGFKRHRSRSLDYWIRIPDSDQARRRTPIVFVHGIGVGLIMYLELIKALMTNDCPIVCIELPFVSSKLGACEVPSISEQVASVESLCKRWGFETAMFVGHSYGSVMLSWMAQHLPHRVAGLAFIDPVVLMLNLKDVLYNFLYKDEGGDGIADIIGTELGVNIALRRNFWWYRNILWACDLQRQALPTVVCLSEHDEIGPALAVEKHIKQHKAATALEGQRSVVESYMMADATHGGFLFSPALLKSLSARIAAHYDKVQKTTGVAADSRSQKEHDLGRRFRVRRSKSQAHLDALLH